MSKIYILAAFAAALAVSPGTLRAQAHPDGIKHQNDCQLAIQAVTTGHPVGRVGWAVRYARRCASAAPAIASALSNARASTDTAALSRLTAPTDWLRDRALFDAAASIVRDRSASSEARIFAMRTLIWALAPGGELRYADLVDTDGDGTWSCGGRGPSTEMQITQGTALPSGWADAARGIGRTIAEDRAQPARVRQAASCLALTIPDRRVLK